MEKQLCNNVLMVSPDSFAFDEETADSNTFQRSVDDRGNQIKTKAMLEFSKMVDILKDNFINVLVLKSIKGNVPDSVFPNNWFSTDEKGNLVIYSMLATSRRKEKQTENLKKILSDNDFFIRRVIDFKGFENNKVFLEGTGSMCLDRIHHKVYANLSARTHITALEYFCTAFGYTPVIINATDKSGVPIYHTNVVMNIGDGFAVVCTESITNEEDRKNVLSQLSKDNIEVIEITYDQLYHFCGNVLHLKNMNNEKKLIMSTQAFSFFSQAQIETLKKYGTIIHSDISTIETIGGGSARCMIAEILLPRVN